jgi:hypothetical protein
LDFCAYLYNLTGQYAEASRRVISHFITDVGFIGKKGSPEEQDEWRQFLVDDLDIFQTQQNLGDDWSAYGVGFVRINFPFHRYLKDVRVPGKPKYYNISIIPRELLKYNWQKCTFTAPDPKQVAQGRSWKEADTVEFEFIDKFSKDKKGISLVMLDPRYCRVNYGTMSKKTEVVYQFDPEFKQAIQNNDIFEINQTHKKMLQVIAEKGDFRFNEGHVFMFTRPSITGISKKGLGIPNPIAHYRELHQLQVYRKIDETLARDYMVPLRLVSPGFGSGSGGDIDPMFMQNSAQWMQHMKGVVHKWREEQDSVFAIPFQTNYSELSGNGKELVPKDLMELQMNTILNSVGYPAELFHGTLQYQNFPIAVRVFERSFHFVYHNFNKFVKWVTNRTRDFLGLPPMEIEMQTPTIADDVEKRNIEMQLMAGGEFPREHFLKSLGIKDPVQAYRQRLQEDTEFNLAAQEAQAELQKQQEAASLGQAVGAAGAGAPGQAGAAGGGGTPDQQWQEADQLAQKWLNMEEGERQKDMANVEATKPNIHALAKQLMEKYRSQGESMGRQQAGQIAAQGGAGAPPQQ